jgi:hypothetical protein
LAKLPELADPISMDWGATDLSAGTLVVMIGKFEAGKVHHAKRKPPIGVEEMKKGISFGMVLLH